MSGYVLCQTPIAREPYFIENIQMNIYSIEELCYYLHGNLYLVDQTLIGENLCNWISNQLGLTALGAKLRTKLGRSTGIEDFLYPIFKEINYLGYDQLKAFNHQVLEYNNQTAREKRLRKGETFMQRGMYLKAIGIFQGLLEDSSWEGRPSLPFPEFFCSPKELGERQESVSKEDQYAARLLHGIGLANARLFQLDKASEYFWQAYELTRQEQELTFSLLALRGAAGDDLLQATLEKVEASGQVRSAVGESLKRVQEKKPPLVTVSQVDRYLDTFMKEYHRSMTP